MPSSAVLALIHGRTPQERLDQDRVIHEEPGAERDLVVPLGSRGLVVLVEPLRGLAEHEVLARSSRPAEREDQEDRPDGSNDTLRASRELCSKGARVLC